MRTWSRGLLALSALLGSGAFVGLVALGDRSLEAVFLTLVASCSAAAMVFLVAERPNAAFGLLLVLASASSVVVGLPIGHVRLEQPSIVAAVVTMFAIRGWPRRAQLRPMLPIVVAFAGYMAILTLSSAINAPKPVVSARMITWMALSMAGGFTVFALLLRSREARVDGWFTAAGVGHAVVGLAVAAAFLVIGPDGIPGMQTSPGEVPKVAGLAFEANLFASMLGALAPFALDRFRSHRTLTMAAPVIVIIVGLGLGVTRGAYLGLAVGLVTYIAIIGYRSRRRSEILGLIPVIAVAMLLAPSISSIILPMTRGSEFGGPGASPGASLRPAETLRPGETLQPGQTLRPAETLRPGESRTPGSTPEPSPTPYADTIAYRTDRIPVALHDLESSPLIGLGAASYGQRHDLPYAPPGTPDYIGILVLVSVYESGILGAAALGFGFAFAIWMLFRAGQEQAGPGAAYVASLVALLVAYQATNALFFSINWIILGAGLAYVARSSTDGRMDSA